jgi:hypothetical protein
MMEKQTKEQELEKEIEKYIIDCMSYGYSRKRITEDLLTVKGLREFGDENEALEIVRKQAELKGIKLGRTQTLADVMKIIDIKIEQVKHREDYGQDYVRVKQGIIYCLENLKAKLQEIK